MGRWKKNMNQTERLYRYLGIEEFIPSSKDIYASSKARWDHIAKPIDGLGKLEHMISKIAAITGNIDAPIANKAVLVMCADNGVVAEGISQSGMEVTAIVTENMANGLASINRMASYVKAKVEVVDIGVANPVSGKYLVSRNIAKGTKNFILEKAMTEDEMFQAIQVGVDCVKSLKDEGVQLIALGEMGIGNTTTSSAVCAALYGEEVKKVTGKGAGLSDAALLHKQELIERAIVFHGLDSTKPLDILQSVGGFDLCGLVGACIGGAIYQVPIVLDGLISLAAASVAEALYPKVVDYLIASHKGKEPAIAIMLERLGLDHCIEAELKLGEGSGAVMLFPLLDMAWTVYSKNHTFEEINLEEYEKFEA